MLKVRFILLLLTFLLTSCTALAPDLDMINEIVESTLTSIPSQTPYPTYTYYPTFTAVPSATKTVKPTQTPTKTPITETTGLVVAKNYLKTFEAQGITIEVVRVLLADSSWSDLATYHNIPDWKNANTYIMVEFLVTNNSDRKVGILLYQQSHIAVNGEQVNGNDYFWDLGYYGDNPDGDVMPGVIYHTGYYLPLKTKFDEISTVYLDFSGAYFDGTGFLNDLSLTLDISDWAFEPRPEDL